MLVQTSGEPYYARGILGKPGDTDRIARQHLAIFWRWKAPIAEGRATTQGHLIDADEVRDPFEEMDIVDQYEPEAQGGLVAAQKGEIHFGPEVEDESPCCKCMNSSCPVGFEDEAYCRSGLASVEFFD